MAEISVIVPVYNVEKYLGQCLDSILRQDFENFEVICVDDGSTDSSGEILSSYCIRDKRIKVITQENRGLSAARNSGQDAARGKYICYVDSDDMLVPGALRILYRSAEENASEIVSFEMAPLQYENEKFRDLKKEEYYRVKGIYAGLKPGSLYFCEMMEADDFVESASLLFIRRGWLERNKIRFEEGRLFEDADFSVKCYFACQKMIHIPQKLYIYRIRNQSIMMQSFRPKQAECRMWMVEVLLREMFQKFHSERELAALAKYAAQMMYNFKFVCNHLGYADLKDLEGREGFEGFFIRACEIEGAKSVYNRELYLRGFLDVFREGRPVILYGAGIVGDKTVRILKKYYADENILGFAVTGQPAAEKKGEFALRALEEYQGTKDAVVVITASGKTHPPMIQHARELGFQSIYLVDYKIESIMDVILGEEKTEGNYPVSDYWGNSVKRYRDGHSGKGSCFIRYSEVL